MATTNQAPSAEEVQKKLLETWNVEVAKEHEALASTHHKKEFTLTQSERRQLTQLHTIKVLAQRGSDDILNNYTLPRVGIIPDTTMKILFDLNVGRFVVWEPKKVEQSLPPTEEPNNSTDQPAQEA